MDTNKRSGGPIETVSTVPDRATRSHVARAPVALAALSVDGFCAAFGISRALFYIIRRQGRGPKLMKIGNRTLVSIEAADVWRRSVEAKTAEGTETTGRVATWPRS